MSNYITKEKAAEILDCSIKSVYRYAKRGLIRTKYEGKKFFVSEEDLHSLTKGRRDVMNSPYTRDVINMLVLDMQTVKTQMATVLRILNINYVPLGLSEHEYLNFYQSAIQMSTEGWSPHVEDQWADYFVRLKIEDLNSMERITGDEHPWRPILKLAASMHLRPWNTRLRDLLGSGRSNVHQVAGMWSVLKERSQKEFHMLVDRDSAPSRKLIRKLAKDQDQ
jgi:hypothetical protein